MSIFAMNYLNDISEYDQYLVDFDQKGVNELRRKTQKARTRNRMVKHQTFVKQKVQCMKNVIFDTENKIIEDALAQSIGQEDNLSFEFIKVYESKFNKKSRMEDFSHNYSGEEEQLVQDKDSIKQDILDPKEELYLRIIKKREDKLKKVQKKYYFFDHSGV